MAETVNLPQIKRHYYASHAMINPTRIVPKGPAIDFTKPHIGRCSPGKPGSPRERTPSARDRRNRRSWRLP